MQMKTIRTLLTAGASLLAMTHSSIAEGPETMSAEERNVLALIERMTASFEKGDIETVMQTYENSQSIAFEPGRPVSDAAQSRELFHQFRSLSPKFSYSGHEVIVEGDLAIHIAPWTMTGTDPEGKTITGEGLSVAVLRRQPDGSWKMVIDNPHGSRLLPTAN